MDRISETFLRTKQQSAAIKNKVFSLSLLQKLLLLGIIGIVGFFGWKQLFPKTAVPQYQTAQVEKGTLVSTVSAAGTIATGNSVAITTQATGVVNQVYVKYGDIISQGDRIAELTLDQSAQQKQAAAYASYLSAVNNQKIAEQNKGDRDATLWKDRQTVLDAQNTADLKNSGANNASTKQPYTVLEQISVDSALIQAKKQFDTDQQKVYDVDAQIAAAQAQVSSTWLSYQLISPLITAPVSGTVSNLTLTAGVPIVASASNQSLATTASSTSSSQSLGTITLEPGQLQALVNLSEIDVTKISTGQKGTLTLDAYPGKTFTGKVTAINTAGVVSSGVTTYPVTITLDATDNRIYPNMAVAAKIITSVKDDVLLVPAQAVQSQNSQATVRVMRNGQVQQVPVEIGDSSDTQTEIISGVNEGNTVVTSVVNPATGGQTGRSAFGGGGFGGLRPGGAVFRGGGGEGH